MGKYVQLIILACFLLTSTTAFAEEPEKLERIISTGIGLNADGAKTNAIRNAIEQVVGTFVSSETIVKNSELISDRILSYSGGYVKELKVISQGKSPDGLYTVKIETLVVVTKLKMKLKELNIGLRKVEGGSLFGEAISRVNEQKSGSALLQTVLSKYPQSAYSFNVGKLEIMSTNPSTNKAKVSIPIDIKFDNKFLNNLKEVLHQVASEERNNAELMDYKYDKKTTICFARRNPLESGLLDNCWSFSNSLLRNDAPGNFLYREIQLDRYKLNYTFKNAKGEIVYRVKYNFVVRSCDTTKMQGMQMKMGDHYKNNDLQSFLDGDVSSNPPNILATKQYSDNSGRGFGVVITNGTYSLDITTDIDIELLKKMSSIEVSFDPIKYNNPWGN